MSETVAVEIPARTRPSDATLWTTEDVQSWLEGEGFEEEIVKFEAQNITGKSILLLDKTDLKDMGIIMGRRLELFEKLKNLGKKTKAPSDSNEGSKENTEVWKMKMTKKDRENWTPKQKATYLAKIALLNKRTSSLWPGNTKVHIKGNSENLCKMEEFLTQMVKDCMIPEIGFGREAIKNHVLQWFHEKNRKIEDGYDYEVAHKPAKRARKSTLELDQSSCSEASSSTQSTETEDNSDSDPSSEPPSNDIGDISEKSARAIILATFKTPSLRNLTVRKHLLPLAKALSVKCRSQGKYEMVTPLAKALIRSAHVIMAENVNYKNIQRKEIDIITNINELISEKHSD